MKIAILGFDVEGRSSFEYFTTQGGHEITIHDQNLELQVPAGIATVLGDGYLNGLDQYDLVIRTAGLPPHKILAKNPTIADKITTHLDEFMQVCPTRNIIGVTGTKGKGTTSTLITKMLEASGKKVRIGGNIGIAPFDFLDELDADSWVVLELSSFQLINLRTSPHIGVCLMVAPEHLNWHPDMDDYMLAKSQLFAHQSSEDIAIYFAENQRSEQIALTSPGHHIAYFSETGAHVEAGKIIIDDQTICETNELQLLGQHNWQNVCAAITAAWQVTQDKGAIRSVLTSFTGLPFRLEFIRKFEDTVYYNDSFGTTPETAIVAIQAFEQPKVLILGGSDKGAEYDALAAVVAENDIRTILLIGDQAERLQAALEKAGCSNFMPGGDTMADIVDTARGQAQPGDVVLLSTACASFGMFKDYKDRGRQFTEAVQALA